MRKIGRGFSCFGEPPPPNFGQMLDLMSLRNMRNIDSFDNAFRGVWPDFGSGGSPKQLAPRSGQFSSFDVKNMNLQRLVMTRVENFFDCFSQCAKNRNLISLKSLDTFNIHIRNYNCE